MFEINDMVDAGIKARPLTSSGKTLQGQLLKKGGNRSIQEEAA